MKRTIIHRPKSKRYKVRRWKQKHKVNYGYLVKSKNKYVDFDIREKGRNIGLVNLSPKQKNGIIIEYLEIDPEHQKKGYASKNIPHIEKLAKEEGAKKLKLIATPKAMPFWEKHGFKKTDKKIKGNSSHLEEMEKTL